MREKINLDANRWLIEIARKSHLRKKIRKKFRDVFIAISLFLLEKMCILEKIARQ